MKKVKHTFTENFQAAAAAATEMPNHMTPMATVTVHHAGKQVIFSRR